MGTTSAAKTKANRKNARKSTGPKTAKGKQVVKYNALKHGLLAQETVLTAGEGQEDQRAFDRLLASLVEDLQPVGRTEQMLVERIAICYWRLRQAIRAEAGEIRKRADNASWADAWKRAKVLESNLHLLILPESRAAVRQDPRGLDILISKLQGVREEIDCSGEISAHSHEKLQEFFGMEEGSLSYLLRVYEQIFLMAKEDGEMSDDDHPRIKKVQLRIIDKEVILLERMKTEMEKKEELELEAELLGLSLPDEKAINRILRYETTIERQLYRDLNQLERLQRARKGDAVPPPINVELSATA